MTLTFSKFRATARPVDDEMWQAILEESHEDDLQDREAYVQFDFSVMYEKDGKWWTHAWWYRPCAKGSREAAELDLYHWYLEFQPVTAEDYPALEAA